LQAFPLDGNVHGHLGPESREYLLGAVLSRAAEMADPDHRQWFPTRAELLAHVKAQAA